MLKAGNAGVKKNSWPKVRSVAMNPHGGGNRSIHWSCHYCSSRCITGQDVALIAARRTARLRAKLLKLIWPKNSYLVVCFIFEFAMFS